MRILIPALIVAALAVTACEPKTPAEKLGDVVEDVVEPTPKTPGEKLGSAVEEAGDDIQDRSK
jgi:hypothetical protein